MLPGLRLEHPVVRAFASSKLFLVLNPRLVYARRKPRVPDRYNLWES